MNYLKSGDTIAIAATARHISEEQLNPAIQLFTSWGLDVVQSNSIFSVSDSFAGTDEQRIEALQILLDDEKIKAIVCARGGYGTVRILDKLDFTKFIQNPKWIVGFSDVTALFSHIYSNYTVSGIHACMPITMQGDLKDEASIESLKKALFGNEINYTFSSNTLNRNIDVEGILIGGNLSVLCSLMGSKSEMNFDDKILFIEDVGEYYYHMDRMMQVLKRAEKLKKLRALLVGGMNDMNENQSPFEFNKTCYEIISENVSDYNFPVFYSFPAGHEKTNMAIKLGENAKLSICKNEINFSQH